MALDNFLPFLSNALGANTSTSTSTVSTSTTTNSGVAVEAGVVVEAAVEAAVEGGALSLVERAGLFMLCFAISAHPTGAHSFSNYDDGSLVLKLAVLLEQEEHEMLKVGR